MKVFSLIAALLLSSTQALTLRGDVVDHSNEFFKAGDSGMVGANPYERQVPAHFSGENLGDDNFMRSVHEKYALEGKNKDGTPNGKFWLDRGNASACAMEVLTNNMGMDVAKANEHLNEYFTRAWAHFDVNQVGRIHAVEAANFMRFVAGERNIDKLFK